MMFYPTHYYGINKKCLLELDNPIDSEVHIMWTGMYVYPWETKSDDIDKVADVLGRRPFIWENYPVNDYFTCSGITRLHLGPLRTGQATHLNLYQDMY